MRPAGWGGGMVPAGHHRREGGGGGEEDQPHPPLLCVGWGGNGQVAECHRGGNGCGFFVFVWDERPPQRKSYFLLRVFFLWEGEYTGREVWQKLHRGGDIHQVGGYA